jgi:hypothetical protein
MRPRRSTARPARPIWALVVLVACLRRVAGAAALTYVCDFSVDFQDLALEPAR